MQFYYIRHGQSENNRRWALSGSHRGRSHDPDLTEVGRQQVEHLAAFLSQKGRPGADDGYDPQNVAGFGFTHLYSSLMLRAVTTGTILSQALGLPLVGWADAHETGGIFRLDQDTEERTGLPGKNRAYFAAHFPDLVLPESLGEAGWWNRPFEAREERTPRARRFLHDLMARHGDTGDRVAVVAHGGFYNHLLQAIFDLPDGRDRWFMLNNTGMTRIDFEDGAAWLAYANRVDFLPPSLIT
jgi:2,3-bisphosphoglycerate-dependent phosphoglycerate mutase